MTKRIGARNPDAQELIIKKAAKMFAKHGYDAVSIRDIASECKIHLSTLYYYFPRKRDLYEIIVSRGFDTMCTAIESASGREGGPRFRLELYVRKVVELLLSNSVEVMVFDREVQNRGTEFSVQIDHRAIRSKFDVRQILTDIIKETESDVLDSIPADRFGDISYAMIYGIVRFRVFHRAVLEDKRLSQDSLVREIMIILDRILGLQPDAARTPAAPAQKAALSS